MSPQREPIMTPPRGVKPMEVSTDMPWSIAVTEQPPPRWQVISLRSSRRSPKISAVRMAM